MGTADEDAAGFDRLLRHRHARRADIATEEENFVARVKEITSGTGARVILDPVGGPFLEKLAEAAAMVGIVFEYGWLSMQPTPFPLLTALTKGLNVGGYSLRRSREIRRSCQQRRIMSTTGWPMDDSIRRLRGH